MRINNTLKLIIAIIIFELAGIIGSFFTTPSIVGWYTGIVKPALNPPAWVFGPVWTTPFALMGISAFLIWKKGLDRIVRGPGLKRRNFMHIDGTNAYSILM